MTRISFLVPTFNRAGYIAEALAAICAQMGPDDEVLVIDDGSTDGTSHVVAACDARIRYARQENSGKSSALNRGLRMTDGAFVFICDDDDALRPGAVAVLHDALEQSDSGFVFARYSRFRTEQGQYQDLGTGYWPDLGRGSLPRHIFEDAFVMQNAALVRRSAYEAVGPFNEQMPRSLDYEMFVRLAASVPCGFVDSLAFDQRKHDGLRGPGTQLHSASLLDDVWQYWDRRIFENLARHAPISLFEAMFDCADPILLRRAALLQRATVMVRHDCWPEALGDFAAAVQCSTALIDRGERAICARALNGKHGLQSAFAPDRIAGLISLAKGTDSGREIVASMLAGTLWRLRLGDRMERRQLGTALGHFFLAGLGRAVARAFREKQADEGLVKERSSFPASGLLIPGSIPPAQSSSPAQSSRG